MAEFVEKYINPFTDYGFKQAQLSATEVEAYQDSLKYYRDLKNSLDTASDERAESIATAMLTSGYQLDEVSKLTGLALGKVQELSKKIEMKVNRLDGPH